MELKILGKVTKINPGPAPGSTPKEKQAGKIIRPAIRPTKVSSPAIQTASPVRDLSLWLIASKKMHIAPMPTESVKKASVHCRIAYVQNQNH